MRDRHLPSVIQELLRAQKNQILVGPSWLGAPGGYQGHLPQTRVNFDDEERVCLDFPTSGSVTSGSTLVTNLNRIRAWLSPAKWFMPHATEPPSMYLYVEPGIAYLHGTTGSPIVFPGGFTSGSFEHNSSGSPRIDLLYLEGNYGTLEIKQGTPSGSPVAPWPLSGSPFPIAEVYIRHCSGSIFNKCSSGSATGNYIYRDVRPFITFPGAGGGGGGGLVNHTHTAIDGGQLDWDDIWVDAVHTHQAAGEGGQIDHGAALTGLADDDHPQYIKDNEYTAKGDILAGTGAGTFNAQALGNTYEFLMANAAAADGVSWHSAPRWTNVLVVDPDGGEFATVTDAMAAVAGNAADNRWAIFVMADVGPETVTLKDYVDIVGLGAQNAQVSGEGLCVSGSPTDVCITNMYLGGTIDLGGGDNAVDFDGGNVDFHHCYLYTYQDEYMQGSAYSTVHITGGTHRFFGCEIVSEPYEDTWDGGGHAVDALSASGPITLDFYNCAIKNLSTNNYDGIYAAEVYGNAVEINVRQGTCIEANGGQALEQASGAAINVYSAEYDPDDVSGTITGAGKDLVVGDLTVLDNPFVAFAALADSAKGQLVFNPATHGTTTIATSFEDMDGSSLTVTVPTGQTAAILLIALADIKNNGGGGGTRTWMQIINVTDSTTSYNYTTQASNSWGSIVVAFVENGISGTKEYRIQWRTHLSGDTSEANRPLLIAAVMPT